MERRTLLQSLGLGPFALSLEAVIDSPEGDAKSAARAREVLEVALAFPRGGGYDKTWGGTGVPEEIRHADERILAAGTNGTYCCGFTFAVAMRVLARRDALQEKSAADVRAFQKTWYGATGAAAEKQCASAVAQLGVGREVARAKAAPGDFMQLWRATEKPSGHSVLFVSWIDLGDGPAGVVYLSSQASTDGIGLAVEWFADSGFSGGRVDRERVYFARLE